MSHVTLVVDNETLEKIINFYEPHQVQNKNPHALFMAKSNNTTITVFKTNKVLFQGKNAKYEASIFKSMVKPLNKQLLTKAYHATNTNHQKNYYLPSIGSDEVGTGDYFGPVIVCAAYLDENHIEKIKHLKLADSKTLTDNEIIKIAPTLFQLLPHSILTVKNETYNELVEQGMNLNEMKARLHQKAVNNVREKINKDDATVIIDQFCSEKNFIKYTNDENWIKRVTFVTKAESQYLSVACASMMARYEFLRVMDDISNKVGMRLQKGASNKVDEQGKRLVKQYGPEILNKIAKVHFKNTEKIFNK